MAILEIFLTFIGFPVVAAAVHKGSGLSRIVWFIAVVVIGLFAVSIGNISALLVVGIFLCIVAGTTGKISQRHDTDGKKCPYCAEVIKREAIICRFCGKEISQISTAES